MGPIGVTIDDMGSRARQTDFDDDDRLIAATVRALAGAANMSQNEVAERIGMNKSTYSRRLHAGFLASDVKRLALLFGVPVGEIYDGLGGTDPATSCAGHQPPTVTGTVTEPTNGKARP